MPSPTPTSTPTAAIKNGINENKIDGEEDEFKGASKPPSPVTATANVINENMKNNEKIDLFGDQTPSHSPRTNIISLLNIKNYDLLVIKHDHL